MLIEITDPPTWRCHYCGRRWLTMINRIKCENTCFELRMLKRMEKRVAETKRAEVARRG